MSRLPQFLVIGAMKSGTTTLWHDLSNHPDLAMADKELGLLHPGMGSDEWVRARYARHFAGARDLLRVEVCTTYAMRPHFDGVPARARHVLGPDVRVVYLVRHPVDRIVSHYQHDTASGRLSVDIDTAVREDTRLVDYTRYAMQLEPWVAEFGLGAVHVVQFETYVSDRAGTLAELCRFLGVQPLAEVGGQVHNASEGKRVATGVTRRFLQSRLYRLRLRPLVPAGLRRQSVRHLLPEASGQPARLSRDSLEMVEAELHEDLARLSAFTGAAASWQLAAGTQATATLPNHRYRS